MGFFSSLECSAVCKEPHECWFPFKTLSPSLFTLESRCEYIERVTLRVSRSFVLLNRCVVKQVSRKTRGQGGRLSRGGMEPGGPQPPCCYHSFPHREGKQLSHCNCFLFQKHRNRPNFPKVESNWSNTSPPLEPISPDLARGRS